MSEDLEPSGGEDASPRRGRGYVDCSTRVLVASRHLRRR